MRIGVVLALGLVVVAGAACGGGAGGGLFRQYEYEEEMYLSLDGSAAMYVNSSIPALNALRGTSFAPHPTARIDRDEVRRYFTTPATRVTRVSTSRRGGRQFVHVRLDVPDVTRLGDAMPFAWSVYRMKREGELVVYEQTVGPPASPGGNWAGWAGDELIAFRIHIPSVVAYHNAGAPNLRRGNILVWEQSLAERLKGAPLQLEAHMESQSILYWTLFLFAGMFGVVALMFSLIIWQVIRRGRRTADGQKS
jgi:hypothetical protein